MFDFGAVPIIAAVHTNEDFLDVLKSNLEIIFMMNASILNLEEYIEMAHKANMKIFVHVDLAEGIAKDSAGMKYIAGLGTDGIITTRISTLKAAKECGLKTVLRCFVVDSHSVSTAIDAVKTNKPDMLEVMPGVIPKIIKTMYSHVKIPIITGGLIDTKTEIFDVLSAGASAVSTSDKKLWEA